jgi:2-keto-4-pentenoate hydratase/2-oxohepta-3-ene-1,7-dioic acid hydratase in catechol pathway
VRLVSHRSADGLRAGVQHDGQVLDVERLLESSANGARPPATIRQLLGANGDGLGRLAEALSAPGAAEFAVGPIDEVELGPPVADPEKIVCIGLNYRDHAAETGLALPSLPMWFAKFPNALAGPADPIVHPPETAALDYEAELAIVIGRRARDVSPADALGYIAGAMCLNDVSARDLQFESGQFSTGKTFDTFAPCGPALVTLDELGDLQRLAIRAWVNTEPVQDGSTADMVFSVADVVSFVSKRVTLVPGDIISTGTPAGVAMAGDPPVYMTAGDVVETEIEGLGRLVNPVVDER